MFEKDVDEELSEEDYKLAEEVIKPIYHNAIKNDYSFAKYGVECYLEGYNKANEWHYVKDELPKENKKYWVLTSDREPKVDSWLNISWVNSYDVIAWKEIVLPKESE